MYPVMRNTKYDFDGQSYSKLYPNLHKYPATMIPQIGIELFKELKISKGKLLDPYCGSGSSFTIGLDRGLKEMWGFDINPLAVLISRAKFTKVDINRVRLLKTRLRERIYEFVKDENNVNSITIPQYYNINFWFSKEVIQNLSTLKVFIDKIKEVEIRRLFLVPLSETIRECSYTRSNEFKLYRMKSEDMARFNPDVFGVFFEKLNRVVDIYEKYYLPNLDGSSIQIDFKEFPKNESFFDVALTSPPYGDSSTTVAYGQFSMFSNEWLGIPYARRIDDMLMGGKTVKDLYTNGLISDHILQIDKESHKRALEVSSFYFDLETSIHNVAKSIRKGGISIYIVGNRRVKNIQLPTDQFIAEKFEQNGFKHVLTYERALSNKIMPMKNSPSNISGNHKVTMTQEFIVVTKKIKN